MVNGGGVGADLGARAWETARQIARVLPENAGQKRVPGKGTRQAARRFALNLVST